MGVASLTREAFADLFGVKPDADGLLGSASIEYLWDYLQEVGALCVLHEGHYVDRHFLDDFANYYARAFRVPSPHCKRFHFFRTSVDETAGAISLALTSADPEQRRKSEAALNEGYVGFVVGRPLVGAPVGRTVLGTYPPDGGRRRYTTVRAYRAHVMGLTFDVQGLAFQQQDGGAAVCASTALWSALQQVAQIAGHRTPTPSEITEASGTPFAASYGLDDRQMATALATLGYAADHFIPAENRLLFRAKLAACLESSLPVILLISRQEKTGAGSVRVGHAVAVTGFAVEPDAVALPVPAARDGAPPLSLLSASVRTIYVHDDNLGSHAHYELLDWDEETGGTGDPALGLLRGRSDKPSPKWWTPDRWVIEGALVPKPPKLRMPMDNLFDLMWSFAEHVFPMLLPGVPLHYGVRITSGIDYRAALLSRGLDPAQMQAFQERVPLPRHLGVITAHWKDLLVCELLTDVTAIDRVGDETSLLAVVAPGVASHSQAWKVADQFCQTIDRPLITGPLGTP